jgi:heme exporter protein D|tara:strand:- start:531 stop:701 length:171 start_codon:yes stop_codon:yes gene_type:complete
MIQAASDFFCMGGHALYVWLSYGAAFMLIIFQLISLRAKRRQLFRDLTDQQIRNTG